MRVLSCTLLMVACSPPPNDGKMDSGTGDCGVAKTPANLVSGSFECGTASEWSVQYGELQVVSGGHGGSKALQLTATATGTGQFGYATAVVASTTGKPYCVNAWVKGTATDMRLEVLSQRSGMAQTFSSFVESDWLQAPPVTNLKVPVSMGDQLYLRIRIQNGQAGQTLLVDDVDFWESTSGNCDERH
ncbi:MAG: hypothetical protein IPJ65_44165 [Archangiaceae bacterium]|nr:hypothetical protein [Archangiaceae bacterium]